MASPEFIRGLAESARLMFAGSRNPSADEVAAQVAGFRKALVAEGIDPQTAHDSAVRTVNALARFADIGVTLRTAADELLASMDEMEEIGNREGNGEQE